MNIKTQRKPQHLQSLKCMLLLVPGAATAALLLAFLSLPTTVLAWKEINHQSIVDYAALKAGSLTTPISFSSTQRSLLQQGAYDEDHPETRSLNHAYNPISGGGFPLGSTARSEIAIRWTSMTSAFAAGNYNGGDDYGAWHFLGRVSHLMQDMGSPLHAFAIEHLTPSCKFEAYWADNAATLNAILSSSGGPLLSSTLDAKATEKLDSFTATRLQDRFNNSSPNKNNDDARGYVEVMDWISYFRATFWGQVTMGSSSGNGTATSSSTTSTTFSDGTVSAQVNVLHNMFGNGNVRWINTFLGDDYYEITDRNGYVFRYMSQSDIDDWAACGHDGWDINDGWGYGTKDSSIRVGGSDDDSDGVRVTGRFWFDLRELGKSTSGTVNRYCYPPSYPDGSSMSDHLHQYFGNYNGQLAVRYNAGLLGLANRRVTVNTADSTQANGFSWGRMDNFGKPASFNVGSAGSDFFFVAKSSVTLTAPASNAGGRAFVRWLRNGSTFSGNTSRTITINDSSLWIPAGGVAYTAEYEPPVYQISGYVRTSGGAGISGVTLVGLPGNPVTDANGYYSASVSSGWSGTATPTKTGYTFSPVSRSYNNVTSSQTNQDYTGTPPDYTVSGYVRTSGGAGISGVTLVGLPGNPVTDANGYYSASVSSGWSGTATPTKTGYTFSPVSRSYNNVTGSQSNQDYTGTPVDGGMNRLWLGTGLLAGQAVSASSRQITVAPGAAVQGTFSVVVSNGMSASAIAPLAATPTWGDPQSEYWGVNPWVGTGLTTQTVTVNKIAPVQPGTYYLVVAMAGTYNAAQIMSGTHPGYTANWTDGNKVALLPASDFELGANQGWIPFDWWTPSGPARGELALTSVRILVQGTIAQLTGIRLSNGVPYFTLNGPLGSNYVIQISSNLVNWVPLSTNTILAGGSVPISDLSATNQSRRFYRAVPHASGAAPLNDLFLNRIGAAGTTVTVTGSNVAATKEAGEPNHGGDSGGKSVWWTWTAPASGLVSITTDGSSFDTTLAVYTGTAVASLVLVGGDDDGGEGFRSRVLFTATAGTVYQIAVDGYGGASGAITLRLKLGLLNDAFSDRLQLTGTGDVVVGSNVGASREANEPYHYGTTGGASVWWTWQAPQSGTVTISTAGSSFDTILAAYTGSTVSSLALVANNDDAGGSLTSQVTFSATAGTVYQFAVDGYAAANGTIRLVVQQ